jgi:dUTP pyrophosphatase
LAFKHGVTVLNSPGTIDADYRGEIKVLLMNHGHEAFEINDGERIAQMVITEFTSIQWEETNQLNDTERGEGGYGSSGK